MTAKPKPPTPQAISRLLKDAGFNRAEIKMRGGHSGYEVKAYAIDPGRVRVRHRPLLRVSLETHSHWLARYSDTIKAAGWTVEAWEYELVVTAAKEEQ